jgi:hypothetical protein
MGFLRENREKEFSKFRFCVSARCAPVRTGAQRSICVRLWEMSGEGEMKTPRGLRRGVFTQ